MHLSNILKTKDRSIQRNGSKINMGTKTQIIPLEAGLKIKNYFLKMMLQKIFFWKIRSIFGNAAQDVLVKRNRQDDYAEIQAAFQNLLFWSENVVLLSITFESHYKPRATKSRTQCW